MKSPQAKAGPSRASRRPRSSRNSTAGASDGGGTHERTMAKKPRNETLPTDSSDALPTEMVSVSDLKPHPRNYRNHPEDQLEHIVASMKEHGVYRNVVVAEDNTILAGHGVVLAAQKLGRTQLPVVRLPVKPNDPRALKLLVGDNEISHLGVVDDRALTELLKSLKDLDISALVGTGYDEKMLAAMVFVTRPASEIANMDKAAEWAGAGMPEFNPGDPAFTVTVNCRNKEDVNKLIELCGAKTIRRSSDGQKIGFWYPDREHNDLASLKFVKKEA